MKCLKNRDRQTKVDNTHALTTTIVMQCSLLQAELSPQRCRCRRRHTAWQRQSQAAAARAHDNKDKYVTTTTITTAIQPQCANFLLGDTMQQISNSRCKSAKIGRGARQDDSWRAHSCTLNTGGQRQEDSWRAHSCTLNTGGQKTGGQRQDDSWRAHSCTLNTGGQNGDLDWMGQ